MVWAKNLFALGKIWAAENQFTSATTIQAPTTIKNANPCVAGLLLCLQ